MKPKSANGSLPKWTITLAVILLIVNLFTGAVGIITLLYR
jgi:hypothetical protein